MNQGAGNTPQQNPKIVSSNFYFLSFYKSSRKEQDLRIIEECIHRTLKLKTHNRFIATNSNNTNNLNTSLFHSLDPHPLIKNQGKPPIEMPMAVRMEWPLGPIEATSYPSSTVSNIVIATV